MIISIRRILFPTDFSEPAKEAQQYAVAIAERWNAELHLLHIVPPVTAYPDAASPFTPERELKLLVDTAEEQMESQLDPQWSNQHHPKKVTLVGSTVDEILKYSTDNEIDLIVVGTHGRTGLSRLLIGSVAEKVVRMAKCPVLSVHPEAHKLAVDAPGS